MQVGVSVLLEDTEKQIVTWPSFNVEPPALESALCLYITAPSD
jgi:hypothetical protein